MRRVFLLRVILSFTANAYQQGVKDVQYVNPLIGTRNMGHTFPGATVWSHYANENW